MKLYESTRTPSRGTNIAIQINALASGSRTERSKVSSLRGKRDSRRETTFRVKVKKGMYNLQKSSSSATNI